MSDTQQWERRQTAIADFGTCALWTDDLDALFDGACKHVARGLNFPIAKLATLGENGSDLVLRAVVGLPADLAEPGRTIIPGGTRSAMGYTLATRRPVISRVPTETRFEVSSLVRQSGVRVSANVVVWANGQPFGSLEADSVEDVNVSEADIGFLQIYGNLVGAATERHLLTARMEALARERQVLTNEIFHRIKNLLGNVQAIARRTAKYTTDLDQFMEAFSSRIGALSRAHDLLLTAPDKPARLKELFVLEFQAKGLVEGRNFKIVGDDLLCGPRAIQAVALLVFELCTNAVKYGALSEQARDHGFIEVSWAIEPVNDRDCVIVRWRERGLSSLRQPQRTGFGSELIDRLLPAMLQGSARVMYHSDGIECVLAFPVDGEGRCSDPE